MLNFSVGWKHCRLLLFSLQAQLLDIAADTSIKFRLDAASITLWYVIFTAVFLLECTELPLYESIEYICIHSIYLTNQARVDKTRLLNPQSLQSYALTTSTDSDICECSVPTRSTAFYLSFSVDSI